MSYFGAPKSASAGHERSRMYIKEELSACANATTVCARISISNVAVFVRCTHRPLSTAVVRSRASVGVTHLSHTYTEQAALLRALTTNLHGGRASELCVTQACLCMCASVLCMCMCIGVRMRFVPHTTVRTHVCIHALVFFKWGSQIKKKEFHDLIASFVSFVLSFVIESSRSGDVLCRVRGRLFRKGEKFNSFFLHSLPLANTESR